MSIEKFITREAVPFTQISNHVAQNIDNPIALAIWVYLSTLPPTWEVVKKHIQAKFGIGDTKMKEAFRYLSDHKLIENIAHKGADGRITKWEIRVLNGSKFINEINAPTTGLKTTGVENHTCGKQAPIKETMLIKEREKKKETLKDFSFSENQRQERQRTEIRSLVKFITKQTEVPTFDRDKAKYWINQARKSLGRAVSDELRKTGS